MANRSEEIANLQVGLELDSQNFTKALGNVSKQSKNMAKDFDVASRSVATAENKMEAYASAIEKGNRAIESNSQKLQMQTQRYDNLYAKTNRQKQQYDELKEKLKQNEKALSDMARTGDRSSNAYKEQEKAINDLKKALQDKLELVQKNSNKLQGYSTDIDRTTNDLDRLRNSVQDVERAMQQSNDSMNMEGAEEGAGNLSLFARASEFVAEKLGGLVGIAKGAGLALAGFIGKSAYDGAVSYDNAITDLRINLGLTRDEAESFYSEIGKSADGGYTFEGVTSALELLSQRFNLSSTKSQSLAKSMDLLNTLGYDNADVTRFMTSAVNDYGMTHEQALDMIMNGQQNGLNMSGDWLDTLMEYSPIFARMGLDGATSMALIDEAMSNSSINADQSADAVKEFFLRFTEAPKGTADAFSELGLNIEDMQDKVDSGAMTNIEAFQLVNDKLSDVSSETDRARLMSEIYGGTSEYVSEGVINAWGDSTLAIQDTTGAMGDAKTAYEESYQAMQQDLSNEWSNLKETIGVGVIPILKAVVVDIGNIISSLSKVPGNASAFASAMSSAFQLSMATMDNAFLNFKVSFLNGSASLATSMAGFAKTLGMDDLSKSFGDQANSLKTDAESVAKEIEKNNGIIEKSSGKVNAYFGKLGQAGADAKTGVTESARAISKSIEDIPTDKETKIKIADAIAKGSIKDIESAIDKVPKEKRTEVIAEVSKAIKGIGTVEAKKLSKKVAKLDADNSKAKSKIDSVNNTKMKDKKTNVSAPGADSSLKKLRDIVAIPKVKTFTVTTIFKTIGKMASAVIGKKTTDAGNVSKPGSVLSTSTPIIPMSPSPSVAPMPTGATVSSPSTIAPMSTGATSSNDINIGSIMPSMNLNVNMLRGMENELKRINNQLDILDKKSQNAFGQEKINYLNQQNNLYRQQQAMQHEIAESMRKQQNELKYNLSKKGFRFNSNGTVVNDAEKLLEMERYVQSLENRVNADKEGNNEALKNQYEDAKEQLSQTKDYLGEYIDLTFEGIPNCSNEWMELQEKIENANLEIFKTKDALANLKIDINIDKFSSDINRIQNEIKALDRQIERATGSDKQRLFDKRADALRREQNELHNLANAYREQAKVIGSTLNSKGFIIDKSGQIANEEKLEAFKGTALFDYLKEQLKEYNDLVNDKIPSLGESWWSLEKDIEDSYREQLNVVKDIEDKITSVYKKQVDERKDLINEELNEKLKSFDKEKDAYNKSRQEMDYKDDLQEQKDILSKLQNDISVAERDTSISGQSRLRDLINKQKEEQKKLQDMVQSNIDNQVNSMYDNESDRLKDNAEKSIKDLENKWSDSNIADMVNKALGSGTFTDIDGNVKNLQSTMSKFLDESGSAFGVLGNVIKNDLNSNLQQALDTFKNLSTAYRELDIKIPSVDYSSQRYNPSASSQSSTTTNNVSPVINFNQPLINVQGNVTKDIMPQLESMIKKSQDEITKNIVKAIK